MSLFQEKLENCLTLTFEWMIYIITPFVIGLFGQKRGLETASIIRN